MWNIVLGKPQREVQKPSKASNEPTLDYTRSTNFGKNVPCSKQTTLFFPNTALDENQDSVFWAESVKTIGYK